FIKAMQNESALRDGSKAGHWLSRIASNATIDFMRRRSGERAVPIEAAYGLQDSNLPSPEHQALQADRHKAIRQCLRWLSERERTALLLRDVEELPAKEVARRMGCSQATVRSHIANARIKLRQHL